MPNKDKISYDILQKVVSDNDQQCICVCMDYRSGEYYVVLPERNGLAILKSPALKKYHNTVWINRPRIRPSAWPYKKGLVLEIEDPETFSMCAVCSWTEDDIFHSVAGYEEHTVALEGDVYDFFELKDLYSMSSHTNNDYDLVAHRCLQFKIEENPNLHKEVDFIKRLHAMYIKAVEDGHIEDQPDKDIFYQINLFLRFYADRKERSKAKRTGQKRANKAARREARESAKNKP